MCSGSWESRGSFGAAPIGLGAEIANLAGHGSAVKKISQTFKKGENGELWENKNGDFLRKSTSEHPVFSADSLSNTIGNALEPLSLHSGGGRVESRPVRHPSVVRVI